MEREVSSSIMLSVTMVMLAVLTSVILYTVVVGRGVSEFSASKAHDISSAMESGELSGIASYGETKMPKATIFYVITKEETAVNLINYNGFEYTVKDGLWECSLDGKRYASATDLLQSYGLKGKCSVEVIAKDGQFQVYIADL